MRSHESPVSYLDQVSLNRLADKQALDSYLRKQKETSSDVRFLMTGKLRESVRELVRGLPKVEQDLVTMRYWDDLSVEEIADNLEMEKNAVQDQLTKTLAKLRSRILDKCQRRLGEKKGPYELDDAAHL